MPRLLLLPLTLAAAGCLALAMPGGAVQLSRETRLAGCRSCHPAVAAEWDRSAHARSWSNPYFQAHANHPEQCSSCHAPVDLMTRSPYRIRESAEDNDAWTRPANRTSGVDCLACHLLSDGAVAATRSIPDAPCRPRAEARISSVSLCNTCHGVKGSVDQWLNSSFARDGVGCTECHMPAVFGPRAEGRAPHAGRSHIWRGADDEDFLRSSVELHACRDGESLRVEIRNTGAGHSIPAEILSRAFLLDVSVRDREGVEIGWRREAMGAYEPPSIFLFDTHGRQIPANGALEFAYPLPIGATADLTLSYRRHPTVLAAEAVVLHEAHVLSEEVK